MRVMRRVVVGIVAMLSVAAVWVSAQSRIQSPDYRTVPVEILSGENIGFRVEARNEGSAFGTLVVRIDGKWVRAEFVRTPMSPATAR